MDCGNVKIFKDDEEMSFKKGVFIGLSVISASIFFIFWLQMKQQVIKPPVPKPDIGKADVTLKNMELSETSEGDLAWRLKAEEAELYEKQGNAYLTKVVLSYSGEEGQEIVLTGNRGKIDLSEKNVFLEGNVKAFSNQLYLKTKTLSWLPKKRIVLTEDPVWLKQNNIQITGRGMSADINLRKIKVNKDVTTGIY